jgi:hypothetical protein
MSGFFALLGVLISFLYKTNQKYGKIENKKLYYFHIAFMVLAMLLTYLSFTSGLQLLYKFDEIIYAVNNTNGFLSSTVNIIVWIIYTLANIVILFSTFAIAQRSNKARKIFIIAIPVSLFTGGLRMVNELIAKSTVEVSVSATMILISMLLFSIPYVALYFFYNNQKVKQVLFISDI